MTTPLSLETLHSLKDRVKTPDYARAELTPGILHIGVGNFHRSHMAVYLDRLFCMDEARDWSIIGAGMRPADGIMREKLAAQDWLTTVVELDPEGLSARVTGAMMDFLPIDRQAIFTAMCDPAIRIVSLTVTEGGYYLDAATGTLDVLHPDIKHDAMAPAEPCSAFGLILKALAARRAAGHVPFTVLSCDNLPGNGHIARQTTEGLARLSDPEFADWVGAHVAFPNSMVDCITPATSERELLLVRDRFGIADLAPVVCEPFRQWVIEDQFTADRPPLEKVDVTFVPDVTPYELMKLRVLNAGHAMIAYAGELLGYHYVHEAMADDDIRNWLVSVLTHEAIATLKPLDGLDYKDYIGMVVTRFANPGIGDTLRRLAQDGSDRQPKFIVPTIRDAVENGTPVDGLALELALWCFYCQGESEDGKVIVVDDPQADLLHKLATVTAGNGAQFLENKSVFGNLGQSDVLRSCFTKWIKQLNHDGVRSTLRDYVRSAVSVRQ